jgi:hypothetical protein
MTFSNTERIVMCAWLSVGLILSACSTSKHAQPSTQAVERFWEPLLENCSKTETHVSCDINLFHTAVNKAHECWEVAGNLGIDLRECEELAKTDKQQLKGKIYLLEQELDKWWRLPLVYGGIGLLAGFAIAIGLNGL